jgi:hypothetical protein
MTRRIAISDGTPLLAPARIGELDLVRSVFSQILVPQAVFDARIGSAGCERIEHLDPEWREIAGVSGHDHVAVNEGGGGDQSVDEQVVGAPVGELAPKAKHSAVEGQDVPGPLYTVDPRLDLGGLLGVLLARDLDAGLELSQRDGGDEELLIRDGFEPRQDGSVGTWLSELRDHVGVEEVHASPT